MTNPPPFTIKPRYASKAALARLVNAGRAAGLDVQGVELAPDGTVRLLPAARAAATDFDRWEHAL